MKHMDGFEQLEGDLQQCGKAESSHSDKKESAKKKRQKKRQNVESSEGQSKCEKRIESSNADFGDDKSSDRETKQEKNVENSYFLDSNEKKLQKKKKRKMMKRKGKSGTDGNFKSVNTSEDEEMLDTDNNTDNKTNVDEKLMKENKQQSTSNEVISESPPRKKSRGEEPSTTNLHSYIIDTIESSFKKEIEEEKSVQRISVSGGKASDEVDGGKVECLIADSVNEKYSNKSVTGSVTCSAKIDSDSASNKDSDNVKCSTISSKPVECIDGVHCDTYLAYEKVADEKRDRDKDSPHSDLGHGYRWPSPADKTGKVCHLGVWIDKKNIPSFDDAGNMIIPDSPTSNEDLSSDVDEIEETKSVSSSSSFSSSSSSSSSSSQSSSCPSPSSVLSDHEPEKDSLDNSLNEKLLENVQSVCDNVCSIVEMTKHLQNGNHPLLTRQENNTSLSAIESWTDQQLVKDNQNVNEISTEEQGCKPLDFDEQSNSETLEQTLEKESKRLEEQSEITREETGSKNFDNCSSVVISDCDSPQKTVSADRTVKTVNTHLVISLSDDEGHTQKSNLPVKDIGVSETSTPNPVESISTTDTKKTADDVDDDDDDDVIIIEDDISKTDGELETKSKDTGRTNKRKSSQVLREDGVVKSRPVVSSLTFTRDCDGATGDHVDVDSFTEVSLIC